MNRFAGAVELVWLKRVEDMLEAALERAAGLQCVHREQSHER